MDWLSFPVIQGERRVFLNLNEELSLPRWLNISLLNIFSEWFEWWKGYQSKVYHDLNRGQHFMVRGTKRVHLMSSAPSCACSTYTSATVECPGVPSRLTLRHPAAAARAKLWQMVGCELWRSEGEGGEDCWEVIFTRCRSRRRLRWFNLLWEDLTVTESRRHPSLWYWKIWKMCSCT